MLARRNGQLVIAPNNNPAMTTKAMRLGTVLLRRSDATESATARLNAMTRTNDGFQIAEMDLQLRGPGHFFGTQQHGLPEFKMADITSEIELLKVAREDAMKILEHDPKLSSPVHRHLRDALRKQFGDAIMLAQVG